MKNKPQAGPGSRTIDAFLAGIAKSTGGAHKRASGGWSVRPEGESAVLILQSPKTDKEWKTRLNWVERQAASFLLSAPILYEIAFPPSRVGSQHKNAIRLSLGFSLSVGEPCATRVVVTWKRGDKRVTLEEATDIQAPKRCVAKSLTRLPAWAEKGLPMLAEGVREGAERYGERADVRAALTVLDKSQKRQLTEVDRLYNMRNTGDERGFGLDEETANASESLDSEWHRLQQVAYDRYAARIRWRILSLGVLVAKKLVGRRTRN